MEHTRPHSAVVLAARSLQEPNLFLSRPGPLYMLPGDPRGESWGYTASRWDGSFLTIDHEKKRIVCWVLHAHPERRGLFRTLMHGIEASGLRVAVPVPMKEMREILERYGFVPHQEDGADFWERSR